MGRGSALSTVPTNPANVNENRMSNQSSTPVAIAVPASSTNTNASPSHDTSTIPIAFATAAEPDIVAMPVPSRRFRF